MTTAPPSEPPAAPTSGAGRLARLPCGRRTKWIVLLLWIVAILAAGPLAGKLTGAQENDAVAWLPSSAESTQVVQLGERFRSSDEIPTLVVYERTSGITDADRDAVAGHAREFARLDGVSREVTGPIPAANGQALQLVVPVDLGADGWELMPDLVTEMGRIASEAPDGLAHYVTGPGGFAADSAEAFSGIDSTLLFAAMSVVIVLLLLTYRSPVLWLLPVLSAVGALTLSQGMVYLLAEYADLTVNAQSAGIMIVLVFGAGTDYALLLVARYREELRRHEDRHEAMAFALRRAGPAIVASAATVAIGLLCLLLAEMNSTAGLGPVAAVGVAIALLAMITLLPALLVIVGRWAFWPLRPRFGSADHTETSLWARVGSLVARAPRLTWIATCLVLAALAAGTFGLKASGLTNAESFTEEPPSVVGEAVLARHFPAGAGQPVVVIAQANASGAVASAFAATPGIVEVTDPLTREGLAYIEGTLDAPADSREAKDTVDAVRAAVHAVPGADATVGGTTAINLDVARANVRDRNLIIPILLVVVFVILAGLLRAIVAPVLLIATVVLSFFAALGISALAFEHVFGFTGADASFPLFAFVFLVALGIDYNIFLMTRVHEEAKRIGTRQGALKGLAATGGVITSAGLVLAGTFAVLMTLPLTFLVQLGFTVAVGVLIDTIVVRGILVTALTLDVDRAMWWPSRLAQATPPAEATSDPALQQAS